MKYLLALAVASVAMGALAEDVWVNRPSLDIREGKGAAYPVVTTAVKGDKLTILAREEKWLKVSFNAKQGYVFENSISPKEVAKEKMSAMAGGPSALSTDAAAKGLDTKVEQFASSKGMSKAGLEQMIAMKKSITGKDFEQFTAEGKVGGRK